LSFDRSARSERLAFASTEVWGTHAVPGCRVGINIDAIRLTDAVEEMHKALEKAPSEITIKFYR
jgi:hypothetical protein